MTHAAQGGADLEPCTFNNAGLCRRAWMYECHRMWTCTTKARAVLGIFVKAFKHASAAGQDEGKFVDVFEQSRLRRARQAVLAPIREQSRGKLDLAACRTITTR